MSVREAARALLAAWDANDASAHHEALVSLRAALADDEDARDEAREALREMKDLAEFWINRQERRGMSNYEYRTWHQLGHGSNAMQRARAILGGAGGE